MMKDISKILKSYFDRYYKLMNEVELCLREFEDKGDILNK